MLSFVLGNKNNIFAKPEIGGEMDFKFPPLGGDLIADDTIKFLAGGDSTVQLVFVSLFQ